MQVILTRRHKFTLGDREPFCCLAIRVLKFSGDGIAMCNDRLGSKHLCVKGPGLQRIEIRQELISCEFNSVFSQTEATLQEQIMNVSQLTFTSSAAVCCMFLWRRHSPLLNANKEQFSVFPSCLILTWVKNIYFTFCLCSEDTTFPLTN